MMLVARGAACSVLLYMPNLRAYLVGKTGRAYRGIGFQGGLARNLHYSHLGRRPGASNEFYLRAH